MKERSNYKSRKTIIIGAVIVVLVALAGTGFYAYTRGNDQARAFSEDDRIVTIEDNSQDTQAENSDTAIPNDTINNNEENRAAEQTTNTDNTQATEATSTTNSTTTVNVQERVIEEVTTIKEEVGTDGLYLDWESEDLELDALDVDVTLTATFVNGNSLNIAIKGGYGVSDKNITAIIRETYASRVPQNAKDVTEYGDSQTQIYLWVDNDTCYYYSKADIVYLNPNASRSFAKMNEITDISGLSKDVGFSTEKCITTDRLFQDCLELVDLTPLTNWDVSNVTDMTFMFGSIGAIRYLNYYQYSMKYTDLSPLANWDVSSVTTMNQMFKGCSYVTTLDPLANWDVTNVTNMSLMFNVGGMKDISGIKDWNVINVLPGGFSKMMGAVEPDEWPAFTLRPGIWNELYGTYIVDTASTNSVSPLSTKMMMTPLAIENTEITIIDNIHHLEEIVEDNLIEEAILDNNVTTEDVLEEVEIDINDLVAKDEIDNVNTENELEEILEYSVDE